MHNGFLGVVIAVVRTDSLFSIAVRAVSIRQITIFGAKYGFFSANITTGQVGVYKKK